MTSASRHQLVRLRTLPTGILPYLWSLTLMFGASAFLWVGDQMTLRYALPWGMISLLIVASSAVLWGVRPAALVLVITGLFGDVVAPDLHISYFLGQPAPWHVHMTRMLLYLICGSTMIWLAHQARTMRERTERKQLALQAMQALAAPAHLAKATGWDVASLYLPARQEEEVGGDFYDFFAIDGGLYGVLLGDVMGKGKEAAAHTAMLRYTVRAYASEGHAPGVILGRLNDQVDADPHASTASLFFGILNADTGCLEYASAGHEPPILFRPDGATEELAATGPLIGVGAGIQYFLKKATIGPGDRLLIVTDGVTEARSVSGKFLDMDGAARLFKSCRAVDAHGVVVEFVDSVMQFAGGDNRDDIAILLLCRAAVEERQAVARNVVASGVELR